MMKLYFLNPGASRKKKNFKKGDISVNMIQEVKFQNGNIDIRKIHNGSVNSVLNFPIPIPAMDFPILVSPRYDLQ